MEDFRVSRSYLNRMILRTHDSLTKEACIGAYLFSKQVVRLVRKSGFLFTSLYLKQCSSSLQMAYGGIPKPPELLPVPVSLNRSGYPCIIPRFHRENNHSLEGKIFHFPGIFTIILQPLNRTSFVTDLILNCSPSEHSLAGNTTFTTQKKISSD